MKISNAKSKLVTLALAQVGYKEGANNYNKYADDAKITKLYGWNCQNKAWCNILVNWLFMNAFGYDVGADMTYGGSAACATSAAFFRNKGALVSSPEIGDQAFFYVSGGINHTGLVVEISGSTYRTVEGNYSDKVSLVSHKIGGSDCAGFGRPNWKLVESLPEDGEAPSDTQEGHQGSQQVSILYWPPRVLRVGSKGADVAVLQSLLIAQGYDCKWIDGDFGNKTKAMLMAFQAEHGLEPDGVAGPKSFKALGVIV